MSGDNISGRILAGRLATLDVRGGLLEDLEAAEPKP